jgi:hypothetical protein
MFRRAHVPPLLAVVSTLLVTPPSRTGAQPPGAPCWGGGGGGFSAGRTDVAYAIAGTSDGVRLEAVALVRGPAAWRRLPPSDSQPAARRPDGTPRLLGGATVGPLWVQYEPATGTLWLDGDSVALGAANVALIEVDPAGRARVAGTARVDPGLPPSGPPCRPPATREEARAFEAALLRAVRGDASVRAFLDR